MSLIESIIYGIIQGLCEFLPISSSEHLALAHSIFGEIGGEQTVAFDVLLHLGTLFAVFAVYFKDILDLIKAFFTLLGKLFRGKFRLSDYSGSERFVIFILIATLPLIPAALLEDKLTFVSIYPAAVGALLIVNSIVLFVSERFGKKTKGVEEMGARNALTIGLFQFIALLPGISRSGLTITGGLSQDLTKEQAVRFSFIMSIPAILGACVLKLPSLFTEASDTSLILTYLVGALAAALTGVLAIGLVRLISKKSSFKVFSVYSLIVGSAALIYGIIII